MGASKNDKRRQYDSSKTRVKPLMDWICESETIKRLQRFLDMLGIKEDIKYHENSEICYGGEKKKEKSLLPPMEHLYWLVENGDKLSIKALNACSEETKKKRLEIASKCKNTITEAKNQINNWFEDGAKSYGKWFLFESASRPDIYIETDSHIIVIEAKRTEKSVTKGTTWLETRDQMIRHINCTYEANKSNGKNKKILAYYIVNKEFVNGNNAKILCEDLYDIEYYRKSIPYLKDNESALNEIMNCYQKYIIWEDVMACFNKVDFPDKI